MYVCICMRVCLECLVHDWQITLVHEDTCSLAFGVLDVIMN